MSWADRIIQFQENFNFPEEILPAGVQVLEPFERSRPLEIVENFRAFYRKYYSDNAPRHVLLGINPGRHGAGATGIPFTDTKRLLEFCGIESNDFQTHEPSSVFVYEMIKEYGGADLFYKDYFFTSLVPVGFVKKNEKGRFVNFNYYDDKEFAMKLEPSIVKWLKEQIDWGILKDRAFCLGTGKNYKYLSELNGRRQLFREIIPLEHPRYIVQYKWRSRNEYLIKYLKELKSNKF